MNRAGYGTRTCEFCRRGFRPRFPNQRVHPECRRLWKRRYQRLYQRKARKELREDWTEGAAR